LDSWIDDEHRANIHSSTNPIVHLSAANFNRMTISPWLHRFAVLTALATLGLVGIGGLVTSHGVGMSVPDWPTSYGYNMFALPLSTWLTGGIFHEHTHRLWASEVGILTIVLNCWLFGKKSRPILITLGIILLLAGIAEIKRPNGLQSSLHIGIHGVVLLTAILFWPRCEPASRQMRVMGCWATAVVLLQGLLGGLRVVLDAHLVADVRLGTAFGIVHGCLGQGFLVLLAAIALMTSHWWNTDGRWKMEDGRSELRRWFLFATILIFAQLLIGATMRHQHAGLAISDFPKAHGTWWPDMSDDAVARYNSQRVEITAANPITAFQIGLQMTHRILACAILVAVWICAWKARAVTALKMAGCSWFALIFIQACLGAWTIWSNKAADVATAHVVVGALSLVTGALGCLITFRHQTAEAASREPIVLGSADASRVSA
jgi:cytochrome c oxidase assembly protein subunit 15